MTGTSPVMTTDQPLPQHLHKHSEQVGAVRNARTVMTGLVPVIHAVGLEKAMPGCSAGSPAKASFELFAAARGPRG